MTATAERSHKVGPVTFNVLRVPALEGSKASTFFQISVQLGERNTLSLVFVRFDA